MAIKITKHLVVVVLIATTLGLKAQKTQQSAEDLQVLFKPQITKIIEQYELYSQFTTDGAKIDTSYYNKFIKLFDPTSATVVFNDLKFAGSTAEDYYSPAEYARFAKINYTYGVDVKITNLDNFNFVDIKEKKGQYAITIGVNKKLAGVYRSEKIHKTTVQLFFTFTATTTMGSINPLKIQRISNESGFQKYSASTKMKGVYLGITSGMGKTELVNSFSYWQAAPKNNLFKGLDLSIFFSKAFGFGTGIFLNKYSTDYKFQPFVELDLATDPDGDTYVPQLSTSKLVETDQIQSIEIPLLLKFRTGKARTGLYIDLGIIYSKYSKASYSLSGQLTRKGYYEQWGVTMENIPVDGYNFQTFTYPSDQGSGATQVKIPGSGISAFGALGLSFPLYNGLFLKLGANYTLGLTELPATYSNHWVLLDNEYPVKIKSLGFEIGLSYKLSNH